MPLVSNLSFGASPDFLVIRWVKEKNPMRVGKLFLRDHSTRSAPAIRPPLPPTQGNARGGTLGVNSVPIPRLNSRPSIAQTISRFQCRPRLDQQRTHMRGEQAEAVTAYPAAYPHYTAIPASKTPEGSSMAPGSECRYNTIIFNTVNPRRQSHKRGFSAESAVRS
jgi:hypothetical protein